MNRTPMINAVLQALTIYLLTNVISHHLFGNVWHNARQHELVQNVTRTMELVDNTELHLPNMTEINGKNYTLHWNQTSPANETASSNHKPDDKEEEPSFYKKELPGDLLFAIIFFPLAYYWQIWLEKAFPARNRPTIDTVPPLQEEKLVNDDDGDESREEAIVQKWIARGKIRRASLSWWNTIVKWLIDMSVGTLWKQSLEIVIRGQILEWSVKPFGQEWSWLKWEVLLRCGFSFLDIRPLAAFISYIIVPAHKRIVFTEGAAMLSTLFVGVFLSRLVPWVLNTEFVQAMAANATAEALRQHGLNHGGEGLSVLNETRLLDEL